MKPLILVAVLIVAFARSASAQQIEVGGNVQVSRLHPGDTHYEVLVAADPSDATRLIVGSFIYQSGSPRSGTVVYASRDAGRTWTPTLEGRVLDNTSDPAPAFGPDGTAYYTASNLGPAGTPRDKRTMLLFRSRDGGRKWETLPSFTYSDRQYVTVDRTGGKYNGRIYVNGNNRVPYGVSDFIVFRSSDRGQSWQGPGKRADFGKHTVGMMGNAVVASDGVVVGVFEENNDIRSIRSLDGGETLTAAVDVDTSYVEPGNRKGSNNNVTALPIIAIDATAGRYKDRIYAVWADRRSGHSRIRFASSSDKGLTWGPSTEIDDMAKGDTTDNFMPTVAVNRDGAIAVMWYDRRRHPDNLGWDVRMTGSLDGGKTFLPGRTVSEKGMNFGESARWNALRSVATRAKDTTGAPLTLDISLNTFTFLGGDTNGLVADAAGVFHPVWIDNRNGIPQVWTAAVRVTSDRPPNAAGVRALSAKAVDISDSVSVDVSSASFDRGSDTVTVVVRLRNTSSSIMRGPFTVRVLGIDSDLGDPTGDDNDWILTDTSLAPGALSREKTWRFFLDNPRPYRNGNRYRLGLLKMRFAVSSAAR